MYSVSGDIPEILEELFYQFESIIGEEGLALFGGLFVFIIGFSVIIGIIGYVIKSIAVSGIAKKFGKDNAGLAWIPVFHDAFCMYVLSDVTAKTTFSVHPKIDEKIGKCDRRKSFSIYLIGAFLLPFAVTFVNFIVSLILGIIPFLGQAVAGLITFVLGLLPAVVVAAIKFVYLRDILDALRRDKAENQQSAIIVTVISQFVPVVFSIYLLTLKKYEPLHPAEYCPEYGYGNPYGEPYSPPYGSPYAPGSNPDGTPYAAPGYNAYGTPNANPYGAPNNNPYGTQGGNPYEAPNNNPYGTQGGNPYGAPNNNPYGAQGGNPYEAPNNNPYGTPNGNPYEAQNNTPYGAQNNNPYSAQNNAPYGTPNNNPYSAPGSGAYGTQGNPPYGAPFGTPPASPEADTPPSPPENTQSE